VTAEAFFATSSTCFATDPSSGLVCYDSFMFGTQLREARKLGKLTQNELAERAGLPRSRIQMVEDGGNVTIGTLEKVIAQLPGLRVLTLGGVDFVAIDRIATQAAVEGVLTNAGRLAELLDTRGLPAEKAVQPAAARRQAAAGDLDEATRREIAELDADIDRLKVDSKHDS
jgi:transcriptional regulator with XRE-family HTH domain